MGRYVQLLRDQFPITAVSFAEAGDVTYSSGLDNTIKFWDLLQGKETTRMIGHTDTVTSLRVSPDGTQILSNSMDNTLRIWDARPYASKNRSIKVLTGHEHTFEKILLKCDWSAD